MKKCDTIALVVDSWRNVNRDNIINVIAHCPRPVFIKSIISIDNRKTKQYYSIKTEEIIEEIGAEKFCGLVTDNENTMIGYRELIELRYNKIITKGCTAHTLSLLVKDIVKYCEDLKFKTDLIQETVNTINDSSIKLNKFKTLSSVKLKTYCPTR